LGIDLAEQEVLKNIQVVGLEDPKVVAKAENEVEVVADKMDDLSIAAPTMHVFPPTHFPMVAPEPAKKTLRHK
jgi:hypothetical protein